MQQKTFNNSNEPQFQAGTGSCRIFSVWGRTKTSPPGQNNAAFDR